MSDLLKRNPEIEAAIAKDPDSVDAFLVYGDWLQEQGDPRGELIALQCAAHGLPRKKARTFLEPARELLARHEELLLGGLVGFRYRVKWRFGFIDELRTSGSARTRDGRQFSPGELLQHFLALPAARFLRRLEITPGFEPGEAGKTHLPWPVSDELEKRVFPSVETLILRGKRDKGSTTSSLGPLRLPMQSFPRLRSLTVRGAAEHFEDLNLPQLREFTLDCDSDLPQLGKCVVSAHLPKLERLALHGRQQLTGQVGTDAMFQELLGTRNLPHLKHLAMRWGREPASQANGWWWRTSRWEPAEALLRALSRSHLLQQLESLDLSNNLLTNGCATVLLDHAEAFKHLRRLDLRDNDLSIQSRADVKTLCARVLKKDTGRPSHDP